MTNSEYINRLAAINSRLTEVIYKYKKICQGQNPLGIIQEPILDTLLYIRDGRKTEATPLDPEHR